MPASEGDRRIAVNGLILDPDRWEATSDGRPLQLTRTEFSLLLLLARHPERAFTRDELLDAVWGRGYLASSNVVDQAMAGLRRKLGDDPRNPTFIETVTGVGYRLRAGQRRRLGGRLRLSAWGMVAAAAVVAIGLAAGITAWLFWPESTAGGERQEVVTFHATARLTDPGRVTGADCSEDLVVSDAVSVSTVTGDITGTMEARSTSRLYQDTGCLSGVSQSESVLTDEEGDTLEVRGEAPVITYRLPEVPNTAVNHQNVSITVTGGTGKYAGVKGSGSCTTLSTSELVGDELSATSESDCEWTLIFPAEGQVVQLPREPVLELSASPARLSLFGHEEGVPSQGRFLAIVKNGGDTALRDAVLTLPEPPGTTIQARATCGGNPNNRCPDEGDGPPPRGSRTWDLGDIPAGDETRVEFTMQLLDADVDTITVRLRLDATGLARPLESREIEIEVIR